MIRETNILKVAEQARASSIVIRTSSAQTRNKAILAIARRIDESGSELKAANSRDVEEAVRAGVPTPLIKRLRLDASKIDEMIKGLKSLAQLDDPVGRTLLSFELDHGLELYKVTCPIGVIGGIFESRPDALVQIAALCVKSGNAVILKGGSEAAATNEFLSNLIRNAVKSVGIPENSIQLVETRDDVAELLKLDGYVDLLVPRGSSSLVRYVQENSRIPVLGHAEGICHEYVDAEADLDMALEICYDAKVQYPTVCNAMNTLLVHKGVAKEFLVRITKRLADAHVELRGDENTRKILPQAREASESDWHTEHLGLVLSVRVVDSLQEAIDHVNRYGTHHTDGIVTGNSENAKKFLNEVDSAVVVHNASTRFSDGYRFGFGAEVGISTGKIHARGPVGLDGLVTHKYVVAGSGQTVSTYVGSNAKAFTHKRLGKNWNA